MVYLMYGVFFAWDKCVCEFVCRARLCQEGSESREHDVPWCIGQHSVQGMMLTDPPSDQSFLVTT
eukprot:scaffold7395_cov34-Tisochrysis_lutea.AAC.1